MKSPWTSVPLPVAAGAKVPDSRAKGGAEDGRLRAAIRSRLPVLFGVFCFSSAAAPAGVGGDGNAAGVISRWVSLDGPGNLGAKPCEVFQVLGTDGEPGGYFMDVGSVVCPEEKCEIVTVRIHFDALGNYERYELPAGGDLTKWGHKPFSRADHEKLHEILSDPYSPLKSIELGQLTMPQGPVPAAGGGEFDAISGATVLSKRSMVVVGAAYTCCTLWHWSHGEAGKVIREMTLAASDKQDLLRYLRSDEDKFAAFAIDQLGAQELFDAETLAAVVDVVRHGSLRLAGPALNYLARAWSETGAGDFFRCCEEDGLVGHSGKRVRFLEALRDANPELPSGYLERFCGWLGRADSYYEVHLLLTLLERDNESSEQAISEAMALLESEDSLVVRRSCKYLRTKKLNREQQEKLEAAEPN